MTLDEHIDRAEWRLRAIRSKAGSPDAGPIEVALADHAQLAVHVIAIGVELAKRWVRVGGGK